jgi:exonuclease III
MVWSKNYNRVALLFKGETPDVLRGMTDYEGEPKRMIVATINGIHFISMYYSNGKAIDSPNFYTNKHSFLPYTNLYTLKCSSMEKRGVRRF